MVERRAVNAMVVGSNPTRGASEQRVKARKGFYYFEDANLSNHSDGYPGSKGVYSQAQPQENTQFSLFSSSGK